MAMFGTQFREHAEGSRKSESERITHHSLIKDLEQYSKE